MKFNLSAIIFLLFSAFGANAQEIQQVRPLSEYPPELLKTDELGNKYYYDEAQKAKIYEINGENVVVMDELFLLNKPKFNNALDQNYYFFLNKKLSRVYPLFLTALEQYRDLQQEMQTMDRPAQRAFVAEKQKALASQYEAQIRDLTTSEGRIFAKLMDRATGKTVYEIIKELRGGWSAFWWNVKGNIADVSIKDAYDPHTNRTDAWVESLLQSNWNAGYLSPYPGYQDFKVSK